ncbi:synaptotagmin-11 [Neocloeon triangulifer]|uniref:synaptotagmin-11 n=1 Tax=Neocloeon triangulifer TaxID=2078957 RepID=UPI00286F3297|nr:synaptotagmin-11 [Neocloeon triangulifer]
MVSDSLRDEAAENVLSTTVTTPTLVGICLGATLFLVAMAAATCFCYRRRSPYTAKMYSKRTEKPVTLRKPTAVKSPGSGPTTHYLKKSPSPTDHKAPPGMCNGDTRSSPTELENGNGNKGWHSRTSPVASDKTLLVDTQHAKKDDSEKQKLLANCMVEVEREILASTEAAPSEKLVNGNTDLVRNDSGGVDNTKLGTLVFKLRYKSDKNALVVTVVKCQDLPARDPNIGSCDPYVKLQLLPDKQHKVKTRVLRKTNNPVYDEDFTFYGISFNQLQSITLHFVILSFDRYSRDDIIGELFCPLGQEDLLIAESQQMSLTRNIQPRSLKIRSQGRGELLVSLCWQPAASRLTVVVLKARNLPKMDVTGLADPYVKIYLLFNNQRIAKKKTHVKKRTLNPVFNESFVFDIPQGAEGLDSVSLDFMLLDWDRVTKNEVIGRLELGSTKSTGTALHHWNEVCNAPRRQIAEWHKLRE